MKSSFAAKFLPSPVIPAKRSILMTCPVILRKRSAVAESTAPAQRKNQTHGPCDGACPARSRRAQGDGEKACPTRRKLIFAGGLHAIALISLGGDGVVGGSLLK